MKSKLILLFPLILVTIAATLFIHSYCQAFYDFGLIAKDRLLQNPASTFFITPLFFWISAYLCRFFAPNAAGSILPKIIAGLEQIKKSPNSYEKVSPFLSLRLVVVSAVSSLISTLGGGALGREAPSIYMAGGIFIVAAHKFKKYFAAINFEAWLYAGLGVGFAVAFGAPAAGLVYVIEKLFHAKIISPQEKNFKTNFIWSIPVIIVVALLLYKYPPIFLTPPIEFHWRHEILIILLAIICGVSAVFFLKISVVLFEKLTAIKSKKWHLIPIAIGLLAACINYYCGIYSFSGGIKTASDALNSTEVILSYKEVFGRILNTILTFIAGCAGGLVAPAVTIGAGFGSLMSELSGAGIDAKFFMLCGMAAFLTPVISMPFASALVILETTGQTFLALPFLLVPSVISFFTARLLESIIKK